MAVTARSFYHRTMLTGLSRFCYRHRWIVLLTWIVALFALNVVSKQAGNAYSQTFNLPAGTTRIKAVRLWRSRWPVEQGYQQMKEELGLDHHEGRSWRGFHHHACLVMLAFGFLALEREREERDPARPGKRGVPAR